MATASSSDESVDKYSDEDRIRKKKPKSKSKTKSSKRRRQRRRHSSLSSSYSSDSDSDDYNSRKRDKPKKKRRKKEKEMAKSDKKKNQMKKKKRERRHDTPSASSSSPVRRLKSRKRRRSPSPSCSTCSSRGRSPLMDGRGEERLPKLPDATEERWEERDKVIEVYDDYHSSRKDKREADAAANEELGKTRFASVVQSVIGDMVVMEEEEKSIGVGNARLASVVGSANYDMAAEEEASAGSGDSAGKDAIALELILRQKALENFRKFRLGLSVNKEFDKPAVDRRIGSSDEGGSIPNQPIKVHGYSDVKSLERSRSGLSANKGLVGNCVAASSSIDVGITTNQVKKVQGSTNRMVLSEQTTTGAKVAQDKKLVAEPGSGKVHRSEVSVGDKKEAVKPAKEGNFRNLNSTEISKSTVSRTFSKPIEGGTMQNEAKVEESSNILLSEQALLARVAKDKALVTETGGDKAHTGPSSIGDGSIPPVSCPIKDDENCKSNEPMVNSATGSEFEQKTFCRVRDGETVQVKYKVYIPKKTPALARRKLQR